MMYNYSPILSGMSIIRRWSIIEGEYIIMEHRRIVIMNPFDFVHTLHHFHGYEKALEEARIVLYESIDRKFKLISSKRKTK